MNYTYFYIEEINEQILEYDMFFSAYDGCERTMSMFEKISTKRLKQWLIFPQYQVPIEKRPEHCFYCEELGEDDYVSSFISSIKSNLRSNTKICIDCTGFIIPHLLLLISRLHRLNIKNIDIIYSEPDTYINAENTVFTNTANAPEHICGFSAVSENVGGKNILIVNAGYNNELINIVAQDKGKCDYKYFITSFPSLQADMYQQNLIQLHKCKQTIGEKNVKYLKAPAYDPFITAQKIQDTIDDILKIENNVSYIHLAPLSTKPQAIACALVYIWNKDKLPINIIYPRSMTYKLGHADGVKRTWKYTIELP